MTESEYLACADPARLLEWLRGNHPLLPPCPQPPPSDRRLRLFCCACGDHYTGPGVNWRTAYGAEGEWIENPALTAGAWVAHDHSDGGLATALKAALLREVMGNPFRPPPEYAGCEACGHWFVPDRPRFYRCPRRASAGPFRRSRLPGTWLTPAVLGIARRAYDLRDWDALPVLADALQEAGCEDEAVLMHLRDQVLCPGCSRDEITEWYGGGGGWCVYCGRSGPDLHWIPAARLLRSHQHLHGPHVRGCHVLDRVLGLA